MDRRTALKSIGTGATALLTAGVASADRDPVEVDTSFDPSSRAETSRFVVATFRHGRDNAASEIESLRSDLRADLTERQQLRVAEFLRDEARLTASTEGVASPTGSADGDAGTTAFEEYSHTISTSITVPLCTTYPPGCYEQEFDAYDFTHDLEWFYNDTDGVTSGTATCDGNGNNYALVYWQYKGRDAYNKEFHPDGYYVKTFRQGEFEQEILLDDAITVTQFPSCWVQGDNNGYGSVYDIDPK